jgi:hypothetical protein
MDCFVAVAPRNDGLEHDDFARRANHFVSLFRSCLAPLKKIFRFFRTQISSTTRAIPSRKRGASRSSRTLGTGCGGRDSVRRANSAWTNDAEAYGEVVWS